MQLSEWKAIQKEQQRNLIKASLREGIEIAKSDFFTTEELDEIREEVEIEDFEETVEVEEGEEVELNDFEDDESEEVKEVAEFTPDQLGETFDVEVEIDTDIYNVKDSVMEEIQKVLFAENFVIIEEGNRAKVVFSRSKGKITKSKKCGPKMKLKGNRCIPQSGTEKAANRMTGIKIKRAKKAMGSAKKKAALKAKITKKRVAGRARNYSGT